MPYPYGYFKPTGKEQLGMLGGSALVGLLSALQPRQPGDASPILKGIEGATAGYGGGYKAYQDMMGDAWGRNLNEQKFGQDVNQFDQQMGLNREKFGEEKRQYEESEKPTRQAQTGWYDAMSRNTDFDNQMAFDKMIQGRLNADKNERFDTKTKQLEMRKLKNEVVASRPKRGAEKEKLPAEMLQFELMYNFKPEDRGTPRYEQTFERYKTIGKSSDDFGAQWGLGNRGNQTPQQNTVTEEDIQFTAKKYGISREEVLKRLGAQ